MPCYAPLHRHLWPEPLRIEVVSHFQIPGFQIVGLPGPEIDEARERIRAAIEAAGLEFPRRRIVVNLSPASVRKSGTGLDFPMALAVLAHHDDELKSSDRRILGWAELGLDGSLRSAGSLLRVLVLALKESWDHVLLASENEAEARELWPLLQEAFPQASQTLQVSFVSHLKEAWEHVREKRSNPCVFEKKAHEPEKERALLALAPSSRRLLEILIAGRHHALVLGPKGVGKTRLIDWIEALWVEGSNLGRLERGLAQDLFGESASRGAIRRVPSSIKPGGLLGQLRQSRIVPGELSRANGGVLIADEFPEWARDARECLREPLETGQVTLARAEGRSTLPAQILLFATGNLCPCGEWMGAESDSACRCKLHARELYLKRLSGPLLDRIDLVSRLARSAEAIENVAPRESVDRSRESILRAQTLMRETWGETPSRLQDAEIERLIQKHPEKPAFENLTRIGSLRSRHKVFRIALTLAALDAKKAPEKAHFFEASFYRAERWLTPADSALPESSCASRSTKGLEKPL
jgi:magnesium chelatase family protein